MSTITSNIVQVRSLPKKSNIMGDSFHRIRASVIQGRAQSPRYIQRQLILLHDALVKSQSAIRQAIQQDTSYTAAEIDAEVYLTFKVLKQEYESFDFPKLLEEEYSLAHLKDHASRRVATGCVYIIPSQHSRFYSIIQPVSAAIAAGNCVMIELEKSKSELDSLLRQILSDLVDKDTVAVVAGKPNDQDFFTRHCVVVDQRTNPDVPGSARTLSAAPARCIAVVDRSASGAGVAQAARDIVRARLSFDGKSPYAPDLVLVNEFVLQQFCREAAQYATTFLASNIESGSQGDEKVNTLGEANRSESQSAKELQQAAGVSTLVSGSKGKILHVQKRDLSLLNRKISEPVVVIHAMRSLDDGINLISSSSNDKTHLAAYFFSNAPTAKYLSQFIPSRISFTNSIPIELLVGPSAPLSPGEAASVHPRYPRQLFSYASPEYISPREDQPLLSALLDSSSQESRQKIHEAVSKPLTPLKQGSGAAIGFFEQGLLVGGGVGLVGVITAITVVVRYAGPVVLRNLRRK